ncbi:hypothetical protein YUYDRAFT_02108 [Streptomyces sp. ScaeMP-e48]|uniref:hypothetical protein n=1 Tax=Streptomyces sp. ScaeMP-e48 TaxID=1100823 RepID=UPI000823C1C6|nr:hypothetical protein [Streptomyces sp. ScaeMP-e48]SCK20254.1 hypothetical protein YUYDRAFT_02108 [Streptomyces sp. ScaeMP-e48]
MTQRPRHFQLRRDTDVSGVSGTGHVADGVIFSDGHAAVHWLGRWPTTTPHPEGLISVEGVHGHGGSTRIVFLDEQPESRAHPTVQGRCPACGGGGLYLGSGGYVTCPRIGCPEPDAGSTLLEQRPGARPAEHCGDQPPRFIEHAERTECVLRPGHQGSHADQHGMRWWLATDQPRAALQHTEPHLFEQNPAAPETVRVCRCGKWSDHHIHTGSTIACGCDTCRSTA